MNKIFRKFALLSLAAVCLPFVACDDDDDNIGGGQGGGTQEALNHIDLFAPESAEHMEYKGDGVFLTDAQTEITLLPVRSATPVTEDVKLTVKVAPIIVNIFNLYHDTQYSHIDDYEIVNPELTILKGQTESTEPIKVRFGNFSEFQDARDIHMIALTVDSLPEGFAAGENSELLVNFNKVYPPNPVNLADNIKEFGLVYIDGQCINLSDEMVVNGLVYSGLQAGEDIKVKLSIEPSLVAEYNKNSDVKYEMFPNVSLKNSEVIIKEGERLADVEFTFSDGMASIEKGTMYIIPVKLQKVSGAASELGSILTAYIRFNTNATPDFEDKDYPSGKLIEDVSGWSVSVNGVTDSYNGPWSSILYDTPCYYMMPNEKLVIDMKTPHNVLTIQWKTEYNNWWYNLTDAIVGISTDGINYQETSLTITNSRQINNFVLPAATKARYIRISSQNWAYPQNISVYEK